MRLLLSLVIIAHGLIHLMGFAKAFKYAYAELSQLTQEISMPVGLLWLLCALTFIVAGVLFAFKQASWWWVALPAVALSQALMFASWDDSKFGTIANLIILLLIVSAGLEALPGSYVNQFSDFLLDNDLLIYHILHTKFTVVVITPKQQHRR